MSGKPRKTGLYRWVSAGLILSMGLLAGIAHAATLNVPADFSTIQAAINAAANGDTIVVAAGTYRESLIWTSKDLTIQGAGAGLSIIDPGIAGGGPGGQCLVTFNTTTASTISGFTFQNGSEGGIKAAFGGGGMFNSNSSLTVTNCTFSNNSATYGGGMYNYSSSPTVTNCTFSGNSASNGGGGMYNSNSSPTVTNCTFSGNSASFGGGMYNFNSSLTVTNCTFSGNSASGGGGGGMANTNFSSTTVTNCTFSGNSATSAGGGMANTDFGSPTVTNCTFSGNSASNGGGGMYNSNSSPTVTNCTFSGNSASFGGGMYNFNSSPTVTNCIVWGNAAFAGSGIYNDFGSSTVSYSDVQDLPNATPDANGNFAADPLFVDALNGNLRLLPSSPCHDTGNNAVVQSPPFLTVNGILIDLDSNPRLFGGRVDMGAYEIHNTPPVATNDAYSTNANTPLSVVAASGVLANDTDVEGDALTAIQVSGPAHGTLSLNADGSFTYTPAPGYSGPDSFTYKANDGQADSGIATVSITINQVDVIAAIQALKRQVVALVSAGVVLPADGNSLQAKLNAAIAAVQAGDTATAKTKLQDFINQVNAFVKTRKLTTAQGQPLIDAAQAILALL